MEGAPHTSPSQLRGAHFSSHCCSYPLPACVRAPATTSHPSHVWLSPLHAVAQLSLSVVGSPADAKKATIQPPKLGLFASAPHLQLPRSVCSRLSYRCGEMVCATIAEGTLHNSRLPCAPRATQSFCYAIGGGEPLVGGWTYSRCPVRRG